MKNRGWLVVVGVFVLALILAACGSGDATEGGNDPDDGVTDDVGPSDNGNPDDAAPSCGNGTCEEGEGCSSCTDDCSCTAEYTACRSDACVDWDAINQLLKKLEGYWVRVDPPDTNTEVDVTVDPSDPDCHDGLVAGGYDPNPNPNEPGDACVLDFSPGNVLVLHGSSFQGLYPGTTFRAWGQVEDGGTRVVMNWADESESGQSIYVKQ